MSFTRTPRHHYTVSTTTSSTNTHDATYTPKKFISHLKTPTPDMSTESETSKTPIPNFTFLTSASKPHHKRTISSLNSIVFEFNGLTPKNSLTLPSLGSPKFGKNYGFAKFTEYLSLTPQSEHPETIASTASEEELKELHRTSSFALDRKIFTKSLVELSAEMTEIKNSYEEITMKKNSQKRNVKQKMLEILKKKNESSESETRYKFRLGILKQIYNEKWEKKLIVAFRESDDKEFGVYCNEAGSLIRITEGRNFPDRLLLTQMKIAYIYDAKQKTMVQCLPSKCADAVVLI